MMRGREHPDLHELHDWPMYGPKDPRIAELVEELAFSHNLRVQEIEAVIVEGLKARVASEESKARTRRRRV